MFRSLRLLAAASLLFFVPAAATDAAPQRTDLGLRRAAGTVRPWGSQIVQGGFFFTGVIQGTQTFRFPLLPDGFDPARGELLAVRVTLDTRMSGEYTIQPTPVPPNGTVTADATTLLDLDGTALVTTLQRFAPIPWVFPVNFPLNVLWALDAKETLTYTDTATLAAFTSTLPLLLEARVDLATDVDPPGWASPHVAGIFGTWEVRYTYR